MSFFLMVLGVTLAIVGVIAWFLACIGVFLGVKDDDREALVGAIVVFVLAILLMVGGVKIHVAGGRGLTESGCGSFARQTNYITKVIITSQFDSGVCYVDVDGLWVQKDNIRAEIGAPG